MLRHRGTWKSRVAAGAAAGTLVLLSACGGEGGDSDDDPITIGFVATLSGPSASIGEVYRQAAELWLEDNPTIDGREVEIIFKDDEGTAEGGVAAVRSLVDREEADVVSGPFLSTSTSSVLPVLTQAEVFSVNMSSLPDAGNAETSPYSVQIEFQKRLEAPGTINAVAASGGTKLGMLVVDGPLGQTTVDTINAASEDGDGEVEIVGTETFQSGATDVTAQLRKLDAAGADALVIQAVGVPDYAVALKGVDELGMDAMVFGNSALAQPGLAESVPEELLSRTRASGFTESVLGGSLTSEIEDFRSRLVETSNQDQLGYFLYLAATSYDSLGIIKAGIEGAGSTDAPAIIDSLVEGGFDGLRTTYEFGADDHLGLTEEDVAWGIGGTFENGVVEGDPSL